MYIFETTLLLLLFFANICFVLPFAVVYGVWGMEFVSTELEVHTVFGSSVSRVINQD